MNTQLSEILSCAVPALTALAGWFAGRRKQNNDFLKDLQSSVNMLTDENKKLLKELIEVRNENAALLRNQAAMTVEISQLRKENKELKCEMEQLKESFSNVKTITRKG